MRVPTHVRFGLIYAFLFLVVAASAVGTWAAFEIQPVKHKVARVQQELGDTDLGRMAAQYIGQAAQQQGLAVVKVKVLSSKVDGDHASVRAKVTVTDGITEQTVVLTVTFLRGVWQPQGVTA